MIQLRFETNDGREIHDIDAAPGDIIPIVGDCLSLVRKGTPEQQETVGTYKITGRRFWYGRGTPSLATVVTLEVEYREPPTLG